MFGLFCHSGHINPRINSTWPSCQRGARQTADESSEILPGIKKTPTFVLESADCHVNSSLLHAGIMIQGPEFLVGTKRHYLSMQESQHDIPWPLWQWQTYANEGECHSHYDPVTESLTPPTGPPSVSGEKKKEGSWKTGRYEQLPVRRTGVTWLFVLSRLLRRSLCSLMIPLFL